MEGNDWDLFAVVRRGCRELPSSMSNEVVDPFSFSASLLPLEAGSRFLNDSVGRGSGFEELEELLNPYFSKPYQQQHQPQLQPSSSGLPALTASVEPTVRAPPRPPRRGRKNQQKKVVCHVPADSLSNDMWAWRKYGQKPIKGSPYPRGYYRCSSSKGCLARKQMERSRTDPGMFTITYTAEHNHPVPTHRNSLAGSTRHKLPSPPATEAAELSPVTASTSTEDDVDEEEDEDGMLMVEDMELLGEDDFVIVGEQSSNSTASASTTAINLSNFSNDDDVDRFLPQPWLAANATSNAAAAGGN